MAVIWQRHRDGVRYEVRSAGRTRRLYTDGVFHSQYNPAHVLTGSVWDLLLLPAFFAPAGALRRVLVLGVGGGAVIHQLRHFFADTDIVGVELCDVHIEVAREYFALADNNVELVCADAREWVESHQDEAFDLVIDDVFGESHGEPVRAIEADADWCHALAGLLSTRGILVMNFLSRPALTNCAFLHSRSLRRHFKAMFQLTTEHYVNYVGAFSKADASSQQLRKQIMAIPQLKKAYEQKRLRYRVKRL